MEICVFKFRKTRVRASYLVYVALDMGGPKSYAQKAFQARVRPKQSSQIRQMSLNRDVSVETDTFW